jgi:Na+/H+ antiporter NhaD/arsenite permease-like protein
MQAADFTVVTTPAARSERWAAWVSRRKSFETPALALVVAVAAFLSRPPAEFAGVQMGLVGFLLATAFFMWERKGFRELLGRHEAELARFRDRNGSA